jgi:hypothetical protein
MGGLGGDFTASFATRTPQERGRVSRIKRAKRHRDKETSGPGRLSPSQHYKNDYCLIGKRRPHYTEERYALQMEYKIHFSGTQSAQALRAGVYGDNAKFAGVELPLGVG